MENLKEAVWGDIDIGEFRQEYRRFRGKVIGTRVVRVMLEYLKKRNRRSIR